MTIAVLAQQDAISWGGAAAVMAGVGVILIATGVGGAMLGGLVGWGDADRAAKRYRDSG